MTQDKRTGQLGVEESERGGGALTFHQGVSVNCLALGEQVTAERREGGGGRGAVGQRV